MSTETTVETSQMPQPSIVARAGKYYRNTRYLMVVILVLYGAWSLYDGFVKYPRENEAAFIKDPKAKPPHGGLDVPFNQWLGLFLPPLGIAFLIWTLYNSRGAYRFENRTLYVPGHPPLPMEAIRKIDKTRWDRKGIAMIDYALPNAKGTVKLDDFVYEREPTDAILEAVETHLRPPTPPPPMKAAPSVAPPRPRR